MTNKLALLGASGHGKVVAEIAELNGYEVVFFDDAFPVKQRLEHWPILGDSISLLSFALEYDACVSIGNNDVRKLKQNELQKYNFKLPPLVHPKACVSQYATLNSGTVVMAGAVVNAFAHVERGVIVNTGAIIEHDCKVGAFSHISPNATLAGGVVVGNSVWIGAGAVVKQQVVIGDNALIGAGSAVIAHVSSSTIVVGVPAKSKEGMQC